MAVRSLARASDFPYRPRARAPAIPWYALAKSRIIDMPDTVKAFDFECDMLGARVYVARTPIMIPCLSDGEIDCNIQLLKDNLDALVPEMKKAVREQRNKSDF
jgi:hypothetical protein